MVAQAGSPEPILVLLALIAAFCFVTFLWRRRSPRVREPEDITAFMADKFVIKPYVQLGNNPRLGLGSEMFAVLWHVGPEFAAAQWQLQARVVGETDWRAPIAAHAQRITVAALGDVVRCAGTFTGLPAGSDVEYRVLRDGDIAFVASCRTRNSRRQPFSFAVAGDLGVPMLGKEQKIAYQISLASPDFIAVPGDIVYERGRISEYMSNFFPVYNSDVASPQKGAPVLRSRLMMGVPGNHDMGMRHVTSQRDFTTYPDLLGYYLFFSQPLNGPQSTIRGGNYPDLVGDPAARKAFLAAAGGRYPRMAMFSFEWGNSFWLMLDANAYMDWTDKEMCDWVRAQLSGATKSLWKFVTFHQPAFTSDGSHANEQRMRLLAPIFQEFGVDVVFMGHVHCYERSFPLRFEPFKYEAKLLTEDCAVDGFFAIDREYDGVKRTRPNGVLYVTSGAAGAKFHKWSNPGPSGLKPYTAVYDQTVHSFTMCSIDGGKLSVRQIDEDGRVIDQFTIEK